MHAPAITRHCLPFCKLMEMYYRFSFFFKGEQAAVFINQFFLDEAVLRPNVQSGGQRDREGIIQVVRNLA